MSRPLPRIETERTVLFLPGPEFAPAAVDYYSRNRAHLEPWEPRRSSDFYTRGFWVRQLRSCREEFEADRGARLAVVLRGDEGRMVGVANLSNIVRGVFQACHLGYSLDAELQGRGLAGEALAGLLQYAFGELGLHRVMANYQPSNQRSERVLERLGFEREGFARDYLFIGGEWRDHVLTALVAPGLPEEGSDQRERAHRRTGGPE